MVEVISPMEKMVKQDLLSLFLLSGSGMGGKQQVITYTDHESNKASWILRLHLGKLNTNWYPEVVTTKLQQNKHPHVGETMGKRWRTKKKRKSKAKAGEG